MKTYATIKFTTSGRSYQVATNAIFGALIQKMLDADPEGGPDAANAKAKAIFEDELQLALWVKDNMTWQDLRPRARIIGAEAPKLQAEWDDAEIAFQDNPIPFPDINGSVFMDLPIEAIQQRMMQEGNTVAIVTMQGDDGQPRGAVCVINGTPQIVAAYINTIGQFGGFLEHAQAMAMQQAMGAAPQPVNGQAVEASNDGPVTH